MQLLGFILLIIAYTLGVITIFLELVCYRKQVEYLETILMTVAFFFVIFSISISCIIDLTELEVLQHIDTVGQISVVLLALSIPFNVFAERQLSMKSQHRYLLFFCSATLIVLLILKAFGRLNFNVEMLVYLFLGFSVLSSMLLLRRNEPGRLIKHHEKIERFMSLTIIIVFPIFMVIEYLNKTEVPLTISVIFIVLAVSKIIDNLQRLQLFNDRSSTKLELTSAFKFTKREKEVVDLLITGSTYSSISEELFISMPTVKTHVSNIYRKAGVKNKMELYYTLKN